MAAFEAQITMIKQLIARVEVANPQSTPMTDLLKAVQERVTQALELNEALLDE